jgi:aminoglycoside phosphotransferase (APT) family kinase protein
MEESEVVRRIATSALGSAVGDVALVRGGVSTRVYRVVRGGDTFYVRVLPQADDAMTDEALAHEAMRARGVRCPEVVFVEDRRPDLGFSVAITTAVPGASLLEASPESLPEILRDAGRDLARVNEVPVDGFGWMKRTPGVLALEADHASFERWIDDEIVPMIDVLRPMSWFSPAELVAIERLLRDARPEEAASVLAHGDFDAEHIYHQNGTYTGIIDFGEIRGAERNYDLGHLQMEWSHFLEHVISGWEEVAGPVERRNVTWWTLAIATFRLGWSQRKYPDMLYEPWRTAVRFALGQLGG